MTETEARKLDAEGKLARKVMTEKGWYVPRNLGHQTAEFERDVMPAVFRRKPGRPRKVQEI